VVPPLDPRRLTPVPAGRLKLSADDVRRGAPDVRGLAAVFPPGAFDPTGEKPRGRKFELALDDDAPPTAATLERDGGVGAPVLLRAGEALASWLARRRARAGDVLVFERVAARRVRLTFERGGAAGSDADAPTPAPAAHDGPPTFVALGGGALGFAVGCAAEGFRPAFVADCDADANRSLRARFDREAISDDEPDPKALPPADLYYGSRWRRGLRDDDAPTDAAAPAAAPRVRTWRSFFAAVAAARPRVFVWDGPQSLLGDAERQEIEETARALGYGVRAAVVNAADFGAAETRRRTLVVGLFGVRPEPLAPTHVDPSARDLATLELPAWRTVRDALADLPQTPDGANGHVARKVAAADVELFAHIPPGGDAGDLPVRLQTDALRDRLARGLDALGRLAWDRPAPTLSAEFPHPDRARSLHPSAHRPLTAREAARLRGFDDDAAFLGGRAAVAAQIGRAFPPPLARVVARFARAALGGAAASASAPRARRR
jgi:DNA (cytosine-5)-methyltransferase 1